MSGCIEFTGSRNNSGYGHLSRGKRGGMLAHRYVWEQAHGPIPDGLSVMHSCDNKVCINLAHLSLGTRKQNSMDMGSKGRARTTKLTPDKVLDIRASTDERKVLAVRYGVTHATICHIINRKTWVLL